MSGGVAFDSAETYTESSLRDFNPSDISTSPEITQVSTLRALSEDMVTQRGNCFDFALKPRFVTAITRQQAQAAKKRVRFADTHVEDSEALPMEPEPPDRPNDATTESSHVENGEIIPNRTAA
ncbi:unnamed protein product [Phytophthora fragariaefolia]|uniref:Unnamed protein product n=1 Tax=Phytophthora fragariaefolia TaxID=1490495 RepID=A0A9W6Y6Z3_9STRA|nr:unnamed protein product [Phytophthora fragariaefolia]